MGSALWAEGSGQCTVARGWCIVGREGSRKCTMTKKARRARCTELLRKAASPAIMHSLIRPCAAPMLCKHTYVDIYRYICMAYTICNPMWACSC